MTTPTDHAVSRAAEEVSTGEEPSGPTVLIAVDHEPISDRVVRAAHRLFGENATYLAINVGPEPYRSSNPSPGGMIAGTPIAVLPGWSGNATPTEVDIATAIDRAEALAAAITEDAGLASASPIGDVGDPSSAIIRAAHHHHADVVVIGADRRNWLSHLIDGSVEHDLLRDADFAVLVVAADDAIDGR